MDKRTDPDDVLPVQPTGMTIQEYVRKCIEIPKPTQPRPDPTQAERIYMEVLTKLLDRASVLSLNSNPDDVALKIDDIAFKLTQRAIASIKLLQQQ